MGDLRSAVRGLLRSPILTFTACASLALGFGANTAIFSILNQVLQRPLPVARPAELVNLAAPGPKFGSIACNSTGGCDELFSYPMFRDLELAPTSPFAGLAAFRHYASNVVADGRATNLTGMVVSGSYFTVLGLRPALGRLIAQQDVDNGDPAIVVLSHAYWASALGADPTIIGKRIQISSTPVTVIGVAPEGFDGNTLGTHTSFYIPMTLRGQLRMGSTTGMENRRDHFLYVFGRLRPGVSMERAEAAINAVYQPILSAVELPLQGTLTDETRRQFVAKRILLAPGAQGQSTLRKAATAPLRILFALSALVALIACANVANLLLVRATARRREIAVRISLGASPSRIVQLLLVESVVLAVASGVAGLFVASGTLAGITRLLPSELATSLDVGIDTDVALFVALVTIGTGLVFGLAPALHAVRSDIRSMLASGAKGSDARESTRLRSSLVSLQVAMSVALLLAAGLFLKSLGRVASVDLGVDPTRVMMFRVSPGMSGYDTAQRRLVFSRIEEELRTVPGVVRATAALEPLFADENWTVGVTVEGYAPAPDEDMSTRFDRVGADYFRTMRMALLRGRDLTENDMTGAQVAIVNEAFVKRFRLGSDAIGRRIALDRKTDPNIEIVGVARDGRYGEVKTATPSMLYLAYRQGRPASSMVYFLRSSMTPSQAAAAIRATVARVDAALPVQDLKTVPQQIAENVFLDRTIAILSALFAILATLLAAVGLYGVLSQTVLERTREIGVRIALGATAHRVRMLVVRQVLVMTAVGSVVGLALGLAFGRSARSLLFEMTPNDPAVIILSVVAVVAVALVSGYLPARSASAIHPMEALRHE